MNCPPTTPVCPGGTIPSVDKAVSAVLNYGFDLSPAVVVPPTPSMWAAPPYPNPCVPTPILPWLAPGEQVVDLSVVAGPGSVSLTNDLTVILTQITANTTGVPASLLTAWLSGGIVGNTYEVTYTWLTNSSPVGRKDSRSMMVVVIDR